MTEVNAELKQIYGSVARLMELLEDKEAAADFYQKAGEGEKAFQLYQELIDPLLAEEQKTEEGESAEEKDGRVLQQDIMRRAELVRLLRKNRKEDVAREIALRLIEDYRKLGAYYEAATLNYQFLNPEEGKKQLLRLAQGVEDRVGFLLQGLITKIQESLGAAEAIYAELGQEDDVKRVLKQKVELLRRIIGDDSSPILAADLEQIGEKEKARLAYAKTAQELEESYQELLAGDYEFQEIVGIGFQLVGILKKANQIEKAKKLLEELGNSALLHNLDVIALVCFARLREKETVRRILNRIITQAKERGDLLLAAQGLVDLSWLDENPALLEEAKELYLRWAREKEVLPESENKEEAFYAYGKAIDILENKTPFLEEKWGKESIYSD